MIKAKSIVPDEFWILRDKEQKIGNIRAVNNGYNIQVKNKCVHVGSLSTAKERFGIEFSAPESVALQVNDEKQVHGYPTDSIPHNAVWDVKKQIPLFTKEPRSRSWYAAGWFQIYNHRGTSTVLCPKTIVLDRYKYIGPYQTKEEIQEKMK